MKKNDRKELITEAAAKVHEAWCGGELRAFYDRFMAEMENGAKTVDALQSACNKKGKLRNEIDLNADWIMQHKEAAAQALQTFEGFMSLVGNGVVVVKRFTKRSLTKEEQTRMGEVNYKAETQEENILRPFRDLSADSQRENLEAAKGAERVYEEYAKRGATLEQLSSPEAKRAIGTLIHADWMTRNEKTNANEYLFVPYEDLDDWTKQQDLDVFEALVEEVKKDEARFSVEEEPGLEPIHPGEKEKAVLEKKVPQINSYK